MNGASSGEYLFEATLFDGAAERQRNSGRAEVHIDQASVPPNLCHAPREIDGGQCLSVAGAWTGDQHYAPIGMLIA